MKVPEARRSEGTQACEVTSPVPISSARARSTASRISSIQAVLDLTKLLLVLREFGAYRIHYLCRRFTQKYFIPQLPFGIRNVFDQLIFFFFKPLLLRFHLPMRHIDDEIEIGYRAHRA